jgi:glycosyltransferase involved in cell wall biosynthesis
MTRLLITSTVAPTFGFFVPFAQHFRAQEWRVDGMARGFPARVEFSGAFDRAWDVDWSRSPLSLRNLRTVPQVVRELVAQQRYDLVHAHTPIASFITRYALRNLRKRGVCKVIYTAHGFHFRRGQSILKHGHYLALEKMAGRWTDYLIVINREDEASAKKYRLVPADRIRYMPGIGVDTVAFSPKSVPDSEVARVRRELQLAPQDRLLLMIAEISARKRPKDALEALARLGRPDVHLALAGRGPLMDQMKRQAGTIGIAGQVHFLGFRQDIPALIRASDMLLLTSTREGLPRSIMEALCLEVPVIGTDIRGTRDLLQDKYGKLVKVGNIEGLTHAMAWMLDHPEEAQAMGKRGRIEMKNTYDIEIIIKLHEALYAEALEAEPCTAQLANV